MGCAMAVPWDDTVMPFAIQVPGISQAYFEGEMVGFRRGIAERDMPIAIPILLAERMHQLLERVFKMQLHFTG